MNEFGLSIGRSYSTITDVEPDSIVESIVNRFLNTLSCNGIALCSPSELHSKLN